jgi:hypothetical protein
MIRPTEEDRRRYDALVQRIAAGRTISQVEVDAVLARVGMTQSELQEDIETLKKGQTMSADLIERLKQQQLDAEVRYKGLVSKLATGEGASETEAGDILRDSGKTLADLEADLQRERRIVELQEIISGDEVLAEEEKRLVAEQASRLEELKQRRFTLEKEEMEVMCGYGSAILRLRDKRDRIGEARGELAKLTRPPERKQPEPSWRPGFAFPVPPGGESIPAESNWQDLRAPTEVKQDVS